MTSPSKKAPEIDALIAELFGGSRIESITANKCFPKPIGCGKPAVEFRDAVSHREYRISGLCQKCQDKVFGT